MQSFEMRDDGKSGVQALARLAACWRDFSPDRVCCDRHRRDRLATLYFSSVLEESDGFLNRRPVEIR